MLDYLFFKTGLDFVPVAGDKKGFHQEREMESFLLVRVWDEKEIENTSDCLNYKLGMVYFPQ